MVQWNLKVRGLSCDRIYEDLFFTDKSEALRAERGFIKGYGLKHFDISITAISVS